MNYFRWDHILTGEKHRKIYLIKWKLGFYVNYLYKFRFLQ